MQTNDWVNEFPGMISVCDTEGTILYLNQRETAFFAQQGLTDLPGTSFYDCHKESSRSMIRKMMETQQGRIYTVEEHGKHELVIQSPWYKDGTFMGLVEIAIPIDAPIPHIVR